MRDEWLWFGVAMTGLWCGYSFFVLMVVQLLLAVLTNRNTILLAINGATSSVSPRQSVYRSTRRMNDYLFGDCSEGISVRHPFKAICYVYRFLHSVAYWLSDKAVLVFVGVSLLVLSNAFVLVCYGLASSDNTVITVFSLVYSVLLASYLFYASVKRPVATGSAGVRSVRDRVVSVETMFVSTSLMMSIGMGLVLSKLDIYGALITIYPPKTLFLGKIVSGYFLSAWIYWLCLFLVILLVVSYVYFSPLAPLERIPLIVSTSLFVFMVEDASYWFLKNKEPTWYGAVPNTPVGFMGFVVPVTYVVVMSVYVSTVSWYSLVIYVKAHDHLGVSGRIGVYGDDLDGDAVGGYECFDHGENVFSPNADGLCVVDYGGSSDVLPSENTGFVSGEVFSDRVERTENKHKRLIARLLVVPLVVIALLFADLSVGNKGLIGYFLFSLLFLLSYVGVLYLFGRE